MILTFTGSNIIFNCMNFPTRSSPWHITDICFFANFSSRLIFPSRLPCHTHTKRKKLLITSSKAIARTQSIHCFSNIPKGDKLPNWLFACLSLLSSQGSQSLSSTPQEVQRVQFLQSAGATRSVLEMTQNFVTSRKTNSNVPEAAPEIYQKAEPEVNFSGSLVK